MSTESAAADVPRYSDINGNLWCWECKAWVSDRAKHDRWHDEGMPTEPST